MSDFFDDHFEVIGVPKKIGDKIKDQIKKKLAEEIHNDKKIKQKLDKNKKND